MYTPIPHTCLACIPCHMYRLWAYASILLSIWNHRPNTIGRISGMDPCQCKLPCSVTPVSKRLPAQHKAMETKHSECYLESLRRSRPMIGDIGGHFERAQRLASTDGDCSIERAEQAGLFVKGSCKTLVHTKCVVHKLSNIQTTVMSFMGTEVSKLIHAALSLNHGSSMSLFRSVLRQVITERFEYIPGPPPIQATQRRQAMLDLHFVGRDRASKLRRAIVVSLANGDWTSARVQDYCTGCCSCRQQALEKLLVFFVRCMCGAAPRIFPRDSWVGQDTPLDWIGALQAVHSLFSVVYDKWCVTRGVSQRAQRPRTNSPGRQRSRDRRRRGAGAACECQSGRTTRRPRR